MPQTRQGESISLKLLVLLLFFFVFLSQLTYTYILMNQIITNLIMHSSSVVMIIFWIWIGTFNTQPAPVLFRSCIINEQELKYDETRQNLSIFVDEVRPLSFDNGIDYIQVEHGTILNFRCVPACTHYYSLAPFYLKFAAIRNWEPINNLSKLLDFHPIFFITAQIFGY